VGRSVAGVGGERVVRAPRIEERITSGDEMTHVVARRAREVS
jgi:hypothetical protein